LELIISITSELVEFIIVFERLPINLMVSKASRLLIPSLFGRRSLFSIKSKASKPTVKAASIFQAQDNLAPSHKLPANELKQQLIRSFSCWTL
jgi:hypothetical protein